MPFGSHCCDFNDRRSCHSDIPELLFDIVGGRSFFDIALDTRLLMMQSSILPSRPGLPQTLSLCGTNLPQMVSNEVYQYIPSFSVYPYIPSLSQVALIVKGTLVGSRVDARLGSQGFYQDKALKELGQLARRPFRGRDAIEA